MARSRALVCLLHAAIVPRTAGVARSRMINGDSPWASQVEMSTWYHLRKPYGEFHTVVDP